MLHTAGRPAAGAGGRRCCTGFALSVVSGFSGFFCGTARSGVARNANKDHTVRLSGPIYKISYDTHTLV